MPSTFAQYETTRQLSEMFAETVPGLQVLAIRDLEDEGGETVLVRSEDKETELTATFDELTAAHGNSAAKQTLFARCRGC